MSTYTTPSQTIRGWQDIHMNGHSHRTVTWKEWFETQADGLRHLVCHIYVGENLNDPITSIPMDGPRSHDRIRYIFEALDAVGHPTDTNPAFDFSIVEKTLENLIDTYGAQDGGKANIGYLIDDEDTIYVSSIGAWDNNSGYVVSSDSGYIYKQVKTLHDAAAYLAREMYPVAAQHENEPRG